MMMDTKNNPAIEEAADRWFARLMASDCNARQRDAFERWRQIPEHADAYAERERLWQRLGAADAVADPRLRALRAKVQARTAVDKQVAVTAESGVESSGSQMPYGWRSRSRRPSVHRYASLAWKLAVAASICLVVAVGVLIAVRFVGGHAPPAVYATQNAMRFVTLPDGTRVHLDVQTDLAVLYGPQTRAIVMHHGRALFNVVHNAARPFTVELGDSRVIVLGTLFQVTRESNRVSVTLARGSLQLDGDASTGSRSARLDPGDQVSYTLQAPSVWEKQQVDSADLLAWSSGRLVFHDMPLVDAVRKVDRYAHPKLRLGDPSLAELRISGTFIVGDGDLVASAWGAILPLRIERHGDELVLLPKVKRVEQR